MILPFALFHIIIIILVFIIKTLAYAQDPIIAKPGCKSRCGNIDIAYPFGMNDPRCYAHKWFEINCTHDKPYLKSLNNLEVTQIYANQSTVEIKNPIYRWNCESKNASQVINLSGSPYVYSQDYNKFVAVACNTVTYLWSQGSAVGGCVSICNDDQDNNIILGTEGCRGMSCCETSLPQQLSEYNATIQDLTSQCVGVSTHSRFLAPPSNDAESPSSSPDPCNYALIVTEGWLKNYYGSGGVEKFGELKNTDSVPAMLAWEILNEMQNINNSSVNNNGICSVSNVTQNTTSGLDVSLPNWL
ncbi:hypothetical protein PIB30_021268 [Stylosanthes scabra]|uniref:Wall-associated receptor kinase galacturonan-binding domain-containing protein n=1 Tax=Stylosanthes scabra TaxID=79078 RepID=A0ABU6X8B9_9FABA|nr:hypothetical protein [Stylosanthes scabra]